MALFGLFGKKSKPNLTPDISYPTQEQLYFTRPNSGTDLRTIAEERLFQGKGLGFGEDFVSRTANPVIKQREARFNEQDLPFISSQLSARGVGRSGGTGLATDIVNRANVQKNRDIDEIYADMYKLNKAQEKQDFGQALNLAQYLQDQQLGMKNNQAAASERLTNATANQQLQRQKETDQGLLQFGSLLAAPFTGGKSLAMPSMLNSGGGIYDGDYDSYSKMKGADLYQLWLQGGNFNALGA